jgi:S1-C subfamily serine protease
MTEPLTPLQQLSDVLAAVVDAVGRSVVRVEARRRGNASGIAWSSDGLVVTAHHAVERDTDLRIGLPDGAVVEADLVGRDPATDLALLRARDADLHPASWTATDGLRVGHLVLSVGRHDARAQAGLGIVSKLEEAWRTPAGGSVDAYVQTDIAVYPGFSGSALVGADGHIVGMNSSWLLRRLSLTLPHRTLDRVVGQLLEYGRMRRGYLGIGAYPVRLPPSAAAELAQRSGLLVISVEPESPAEAAGLLVGDLLVGLAGEPVRHLDDLLALLAEEKIGTPAPLKLIRAGQLTELAVTISERT